MPVCEPKALVVRVQCGYCAHTWSAWIPWCNVQIAKTNDYDVWLEADVLCQKCRRQFTIEVYE